MTGGDRRAEYETVGVNRVRPLKSEHLQDHGFKPDDELPDYDPRTDFTRFILGQGERFEAAVTRYHAMQPESRCFFALSRLFLATCLWL